MKRIFYNAGAAEGGAAPDATATIIKAIDGKFADVVKKSELDEKLKDVAKASELEGLQKTVNELNEKAGQWQAKAKQPEGTIPAMAKAIREGYDAKGMKLPETKVPFMTKAAGTMTAADDLTGNTIITYRSTLAANPYRNVHFRDLAPVIPSATGTYSWYRQGTTEGAIAFQTSHGTKKSIINGKFVQDTVTAQYLAGLAPVAKQMMQDLTFLEGYMPQFMLNEYLTQEDSEFYSDLILAATGSAAETGSANTIEYIMELVTNLRVANYVPNGIVMNPADVFKVFITSKGDSYSLPPGVVVSNSGLISIFGVPVFTTTFVPSTKILVGDWNQVGIVQVEGLSILTDDRGDNFDNNTITWKAEARVALAVLRPDAFIYADLDDVSA